MPRNIAPTIFTIGVTDRTINDLRRVFAAFDFDAVVDVRLNPKGRERLEAAFSVRPKYVWLGESLGEIGGRLYGAPKAIDKILETLIVKARYRQRIVLLGEKPWPDECHRNTIIGRMLDEKNVVVCHVLPNGAMQYIEKPPAVRKRIEREIPSGFREAWG